MYKKKKKNYQFRNLLTIMKFHEKIDFSSKREMKRKEKIFFKGKKYTKT